MISRSLLHNGYICIVFIALMCMLYVDTHLHTHTNNSALFGMLQRFVMVFCRGADPHALNREGKTPLERAVESGFDDSEVLVLLSDSNL